MSEYNCSCHIDGISYSMQTTSCIGTVNAMQQLSEHVKGKGGNFNQVDGLILDLIEL